MTESTTLSQMRALIMIMGMALVGFGCFMLGQQTTPPKGNPVSLHKAHQDMARLWSKSVSEEVQAIRQEMHEHLGKVVGKLENAGNRATDLDEKMVKTWENAHNIHELISNIHKMQKRNSKSSLTKSGKFKKRDKKGNLINDKDDDDWGPSPMFADDDGEPGEPADSSYPMPLDVLLPGQIRSRITGDCLDGYNQEHVISYICDAEQDKQLFTFKDGKLFTTEDWCLDGSNLKQGDGIPLTDCSRDTVGQEWEFKVHGEFTWHASGFIVNKESGLCISPSTQTSKDRAAVNMQTCDGSCRMLFIMNAFLEIRDGDKTYDVVAQAESSQQSTPIYSNEKMGGGRIYCWIMTNPKNHETKAKTVKDTWGRHCEKLQFVTTEEHPDLDTLIVNLGEPESREKLWAKSRFAWMHAYNNDLDDYEWFIRGDDDSYIMMDNLRKWIADMNPLDPHYLGRRFNGHFGDNIIPFYSGGPGTVLSKGALQKLGYSVTNNASVFNDWDTFADDMELGISMSRIGVPAHDTSAPDGQRFLGLGIDAERAYTREADPKNWFWDYSPEAKEGMACCSKNWVASHYVTPQGMTGYDDLHMAGCEAAGKHPWEEGEE